MITRFHGADRAVHGSSVARGCANSEPDCVRMSLVCPKIDLTETGKLRGVACESTQLGCHNSGPLQPQIAPKKFWQKLVLKRRERMSKSVFAIVILAACSTAAYRSYYR